MSKRLAVLAATTALATLSSPVAAQDGWSQGDYATTAAERAMRAGEGWDGESGAGVSWGEVESYSEEVVQDYGAAGTRVISDSADHADYRETRGEMHGDHRHGSHHRSHAPRSQAPRLAYGAAERAEWLSQCRALRAQPVEPAYYYEEEDDDGGLIGGLLGAVVGGFAGNRIADGDRLLGTVIGVGIGGIAGAVIGSVIDGADDEDEIVEYAAEEPGFDYCEAYLLNWERGYGAPGQLAYAPVVAVPVAQYGYADTRSRSVRHRVIEEEVLVEAEEDHAPRRQIRRAMPRRDGDKRLRAD